MTGQLDAAIGLQAIGAVARERHADWPTPTPVKVTTCPACGERWVPWAGTGLRCHARCYFTPTEVECIARAVAAGTGQLRTAKYLGVSLATLRRTLKRANGAVT